MWRDRRIIKERFGTGRKAGVRIALTGIGLVLFILGIIIGEKSGNIFWYFLGGLLFLVGSTII